MEFVLENCLVNANLLDNSNSGPVPARQMLQDVQKIGTRFCLVRKSPRIDMSGGFLLIGVVLEVR